MRDCEGIDVWLGRVVGGGEGLSWVGPGGRRAGRVQQRREEWGG